MRRFLFILCVISLLIGSPAWSWWSGGHGIITRAAVKTLPEDMPAFFRSGERMIAHCSFDPDIAKNRGTSYVKKAEHPEHFLDLELLQGRPLPKGRYAFTQLCAELGIRPEKVGLLPYATAEWTERLAMAFAEYRKWPDNPVIQNKCMVYAGFIAHYAEDMCQPLHLTIHFDGRAKPDGSSPGTGIHEKVDGLIEYLALDPDDLARDAKIEPLDDLMDDILKEIEAGRALIDRVYELEDRLPSLQDRDWKAAPEVTDFATERAREATRFTAALYLTAWQLSEQIRLPGWLDRSQVD